MALPTDAKTRKNMPITRGVLDYFPDALAEVANVSRVGNEQHNPGQPMHWAKEKSSDEADCLVRHLIERGTIDSDGLRHSAKVAWRALALLQREIDAERASTLADLQVPKEWLREEPMEHRPTDSHLVVAEVGGPYTDIATRQVVRPLPDKFEHAMPDLDQEYPPCKCPKGKCLYNNPDAPLPGPNFTCVEARAKDDLRFDVV